MILPTDIVRAGSENEFLEDVPHERVVRFSCRNGDALDVAVSESLLWVCGDHGLAYCSLLHQPARYRFIDLRGKIVTRLCTFPSQQRSEMVVAASRDGSIKFAVPSQGAGPLMTAHKREGAAICSLAACCDGNSVWVGDASLGKALLYDIRALSRDFVCTADVSQRGTGFCLACTSSGALLASLPRGETKVFDATAGRRAVWRGSAVGWEDRLYPAPTAVSDTSMGCFVLLGSPEDSRCLVL